MWGSPEDCVERLPEAMAAGARLLLLNPCLDEMEHLEQFASVIAPKL